MSLLLLSIFLFASPAFSGTSQPQKSTIKADFESLKSHPQDYTVIGVICEEIARLRLQEQYGTEDYTFKVGIVYSGDDRTLGELDVIIFRKSDNEAIVIAEVKCWRRLGGGLTKAKKQLRRFRTNLETDNIDSMTVTSPDQQSYKTDQFDEQPTYLTISQTGGVAVGFDMDIGLDLVEVKTLRQMLIRCQDHGNCPTP